jgi:hypothetical protein
MLAFILTCGAVLISGAALAAPVVSTFDTDTDGWTLSGGVLSFAATGGNPGGHLLADDTQGDNMVLTAPAKFLVPLALGGAIRFDAREVENPDGNFPEFGRIFLASATHVATYDAFSGDLGPDWTTITAPLTASLWGLSESDFASLIGGLSVMTVIVESGDNVSEMVAIDNFSVDAAHVVPLPFAAPMLPSALAALGLMRRRI